MSNSPKVFVSSNFLRDLQCSIEKLSLICGILVNSLSLSYKMVLFSIFQFLLIILSVPFANFVFL